MNTAMKEDGTLRRRITVAEYYRMAEVGLLAPDARVELIDGEIIEMVPIGSRHGGTENQLIELLSAAVGLQGLVREQLPIRLGDCSEPQPDVAVVKRRQDYYKAAHPVAADTYLVVEVCETSLARDLRRKIPLYASHRIPEVWVVDLQSRQMRFYRSPDGDTYTQVSIDAAPGLITLATLAAVTVDLTGMFDE